MSLSPGRGREELDPQRRGAHSREAACPGQGGLPRPGDTLFSAFLTSLTVRAGQVMSYGVAFLPDGFMFVAMNQNIKTPDHSCRVTLISSAKLLTTSGWSRRRGHWKTLEISDNFLPLASPRTPASPGRGHAPGLLLKRPPLELLKFTFRLLPKACPGFQ